MGRIIPQIFHYFHSHLSLPLPPMIPHFQDLRTSPNTGMLEESAYCAGRPGGATASPVAPRPANETDIRPMWREETPVSKISGCGRPRTMLRSSPCLVGYIPPWAKLATLKGWLVSPVRARPPMLKRRNTSTKCLLDLN